MFRPYTPKGDVQKKPYHTDRFYVPKEIAQEPITDEIVKDDLEKLERAIGDTKSFFMRNEAIVYVPAPKNKEALALLRSLGYEQLMELSAIDYLATRGELEVFYELLSAVKNRRLRLKVVIKEKEAIESVADMWRSANWSERECYDMFGVIFNNHPRLSRILMPDDWNGHPLLRSYPLQGDEFARWYEVDKIYGKEFREKIGEENRDPARVDRNDTRNFARLGYEVGVGEAPKDEITPIKYVEKRSIVLYDDFDPQKQKVLDKRK
ncbi:MAG: NADH-quinone oxidoreductase subunit C [Helicobacteraceae bacterium]|jgi:NADH-quinone oxidoreductase subunit C|nr:NADH-quinone oxidoreductase subunit C [Helicobacteraceae bacterium]